MLSIGHTVQIFDAEADVVIPDPCGVTILAKLIGRCDRLIIVGLAFDQQF